MSVQSISQEGAFDKTVRQQINTNFAQLAYTTQGNVYWVRPRTGNDSNDGLSGAVNVSNGQGALQTLAAALAKCVAGQNDVVLLCAEGNTSSETTNYLSANLDWNKNLVHLIGINGAPMIGQRSRISNLSTVAAFANLFTVSASGCLIQNIAFFQGNGSTNPSAASTCVTVSGDRNHFENCQISGVGHADLDDTGSNDLTVSGSENTFDNSYIGLDTVIRASALAGVVMSGTNTRNAFRNCRFQAYTSSTSYKFMSVATGTDRWLELTNPKFHAVQNITSSAIPSGALGVTTLNGNVLVMNPVLFGVTQITTADNAYVLVLGYNGLATGHLIGISQGVDAA